MAVFNVGAAYRGAAGLAGPEISLGKHVVELIDNKRKLVGMIGQPGSVLDHQCGAGAIHRLETVPSRQRRNHARVRSFGRWRPIDIVLEIGEHLEMLGDIRIEGRQQVVQQPIAEQDNFHIQRNRVGFERNRAGQTDEPTKVFNPDLPLAQRSFQGRPTERFRQQAARIKQKEAAIGPMNCARLDEAKIGNEHAVMRDVLDAAQQVAQSRMQFFDDRSDRFASSMTDQDIDRVAIKRRFELVLQRRALVAFALDHEHRDIFDEVRANCLQMRQDFRDIGEASLCGLNELPDGEFRGFTIELAYFVAPFGLPLRKLTHDVFEVLLELFDGGLDFLAFGFLPGPEFVRRNGVTVPRRGERKTHWGAENDDVLGCGLLVQGREGLGLFGLESLIDGAAPRLIILAFEYCR